MSNMTTNRNQMSSNNEINSLAQTDVTESMNKDEKNASTIEHLQPSNNSTFAFTPRFYKPPIQQKKNLQEL